MYISNAGYNIGTEIQYIFFNHFILSIGYRYMIRSRSGG